MVSKRLGRGLQALIPAVEGEDGEKPEAIRTIELFRIAPNPFQPRMDFDPASLAELKQSISSNGLITPVTVRPFGNGFQLIAGERRLRAVQELGYESIPAYVLEVTDDTRMLELALIENVQRENLNPIEEAQGYQRLIEECRLTQEEVARKVGRDRTTIANALRLLKLASSIQDSLRKGELSAGHARALLGLPDNASQLAVCKRILKDQLSVRQVERLAQQGARSKKSNKKRDAEVPFDLREAESILQRILATKVRIQKRGKGGVLEVEFYSADDLERILELLQKISE
ncbi:MAG: ParB/RepB/Spo0J family partition protein [bacterium]